MLEQRSPKVDLLALCLGAATLFLALALFSYDPADPPASWVHPVNPAVQNACGRMGAWTAHLLFGAIGLGAYYLVLSLGVVVARLLMRQSITEPYVRTVGWFTSLVGITALSAMAAPSWSAGPVIGPGGYLGAIERSLLETNFHAVGTYLLCLSFTLSGLLLCTDYVLLHLSGRAWKLAASRIPRRVKAAVSVSDDIGAGVNASGRSEDDEESDEDDEQSADDALSIRIRRLQPALTAGEEETDSDSEPESSDEEQSAAEETGEPDSADAAEQDLKVYNANDRKDRVRAALMEEIEAASSMENDPAEYELPPLDLLMEGEPFCYDEQDKEVRRKAKILERTFRSFGFDVKVVEIDTGPVIAQFEVELEAGLRLSKITSLADDLAIALRVPSVRIVAPIPGKNTVGIEVPNVERQLVRLREVMDETGTQTQKMRIPIYLGKDVSGKPMVVDLTTLPHLLIAGRTGTGKSVCLNTIIMSMLMTRRPDEVKMLLIDPKMVELTPYARLPHLMHPVVTDMKKAEAILAWAVDKMEERYALLARAGVRHISVYNQLGEEELFERLAIEDDAERSLIPTHLPYIVIVADEMADLMMTAAKEVESHIIRLAQKSRAVGIHLVLATQKPTVDVITGLIKSNLPARISFQVASRTDSRVVLDEMGADKLLGNGDMLFLWPGTSTLLRGQGAYVSDDEINSVVGSLAGNEPQFVEELVSLPAAGTETPAATLPQRDELYASAVEVVVNEGRGSVSLLQRALGIGYGRAARLIDYMAEDGIVGTYNGSQARDVLITPEQWKDMQAGQQAASHAQRMPAPAPVPARPALSGPPAQGTSTKRLAAPPRRSGRSIAPFESDELESDEDGQPFQRGMRQSIAERDDELDEDESVDDSQLDSEDVADAEPSDDYVEDRWVDEAGDDEEELDGSEESEEDDSEDEPEEEVDELEDDDLEDELAEESDESDSSEDDPEDEEDVDESPRRGHSLPRVNRRRA